MCNNLPVIKTGTLVSEAEMKRLPWGVYLALCSFGFLLALSFLPLWYYPYFTRRAGEYDGVTLWSALEYLSFDFKGKLPWAKDCLMVNVRRAILLVAIGAALGAAVRWVRWLRSRDGPGATHPSGFREDVAEPTRSEGP